MSLILAAAPCRGVAFYAVLLVVVLFLAVVGGGVLPPPAVVGRCRSPARWGKHTGGGYGPGDGGSRLLYRVFTKNKRFSREIANFENFSGVIKGFYRNGISSSSVVHDFNSLE